MLNLNVILSRWSILIEGLSVSPEETYARIEAALVRRQIPDTKCFEKVLSQGAIFSKGRKYLRVERGDYWVDICAAPFGTGFFFSTWLIEKKGLIAVLQELPLIAFVLAFITGRTSYYHHDSTSMFLTAVHQSVLEVIDELTKAKGLRALSGEERTPSLRSITR